MDEQENELNLQQNFDCRAAVVRIRFFQIIFLRGNPRLKDIASRYTLSIVLQLNIRSDLMILYNLGFRSKGYASHRSIILLLSFQNYKVHYYKSPPPIPSYFRSHFSTHRKL